MISTICTPTGLPVSSSVVSPVPRFSESPLMMRLSKPSGVTSTGLIDRIASLMSAPSCTSKVTSATVPSFTSHGSGLVTAIANVPICLVGVSPAWLAFQMDCDSLDTTPPVELYVTAPVKENSPPPADEVEPFCNRSTSLENCNSKLAPDTFVVMSSSATWTVTTPAFILTMDRTTFSSESSSPPPILAKRRFPSGWGSTPTTTRSTLTTSPESRPPLSLRSFRATSHDLTGSIPATSRWIKVASPTSK